MSTKIYNGTIIHASIARVYPMALRAADAMRELQHELWVAQLAAEVSLTVDRKRLGLPSGDDPCPDGIAEIIWIQRRAAKRARGEGRGLGSLGFSLCLFPSGRSTLALAFGPDAITALWAETEGVCDFGYWDNVDRPDSVSAAQWRAREKRWSSALRFNHPNANGAPSRSALTLTGEFTQPYVRTEDVLAKLPSDEKRTRTAATAIAAEDFSQKHPGDTDALLRFLWSFGIHSNAEERAPYLTVARAAIRPITIDDLEPPRAPATKE